MSLVQWKGGGGVVPKGCVLPCSDIGIVISGPIAEVGQVRL